MQLLILRTHMEMTLCLRQCDRRPRRLARCHQASRRRWSRWRRSCHHCPRHHRRRYQHHHRSRPARCRQRPSTSAGVTARCSGGGGAGEVPTAALHLRRRHRPLQWRKRRQLHLAARCYGPPSAGVAGGGAHCRRRAAGEVALLTLCLRRRCQQRRWARQQRRAAEGLAEPAHPPLSSVEAALGLLVLQGRPTGSKQLPPPSLRLGPDKNVTTPPHGLACLHPGLACPHMVSPPSLSGRIRVYQQDQPSLSTQDPSPSALDLSLSAQDHQSLSAQVATSLP